MSLHCPRPFPGLGLRHTGYATLVLSSRTRGSSSSEHSAFPTAPGKKRSQACPASLFAIFSNLGGCVACALADRSFPGVDAPPAGFLPAAPACTPDAAQAAEDSGGRRVPAWDCLASQRPWASRPLSPASAWLTPLGEQALFFSTVFLRSATSHFSQVA